MLRFPLTRTRLKIQHEQHPEPARSGECISKKFSLNEAAAVFTQNHTRSVVQNADTATDRIKDVGEQMVGTAVTARGPSATSCLVSAVKIVHILLRVRAGLNPRWHRSVI